MLLWSDERRWTVRGRLPLDGNADDLPGAFFAILDYATNLTIA